MGKEDLKEQTHLHKTNVGRSTLFWADCFDVFPLIADKSVDAIIADLPYGTTQNKYDIILPFGELPTHSKADGLGFGLRR